MSEAKRDAAADLAICYEATPGLIDGWGSGLTGPTTPTCDGVTVTEAIECSKFGSPPVWHQVVSVDHRTVAIFVWDGEEDQHNGNNKNEREALANSALFAMSREALPHWIKRAEAAERELARLKDENDTARGELIKHAYAKECATHHCDCYLLPLPDLCEREARARRAAERELAELREEFRKAKVEA